MSNVRRDILREIAKGGCCLTSEAIASRLYDD